MKIKKSLHSILDYLVARAGEFSSKKGAIMLLGGVSWLDLDHASRGEVIMAVCIIGLGLMHIFTPDYHQYGTEKK